MAAPAVGQRLRPAILLGEPVGGSGIPAAQGTASPAQATARPSPAIGWIDLAGVPGPAKRKSALFADWLADAAAG